MISVTSLSAYQYCQRKLFLEKVLGFAEPPKSALVLGTIAHETLELMYGQEQQIVEQFRKNMTAEEFSELYLAHALHCLNSIISKHSETCTTFGLSAANVLNRHRRTIEQEATRRSKYVVSFAQRLNVESSALWNELTPKITCEHKVSSESLQLRGIIDQIHDYKHQLTLVELKTGKAPSDGIWPGHRTQVIAYSLLMEEHYSKPITEALVYYLDSKSVRMVSINPFMKMEVSSLISEVTLLLDNLILPDYTTQKGKCIRCGLKKICYNEPFLEKKITALRTQNRPNSSREEQVRLTNLR